MAICRPSTRRRGVILPMARRRRGWHICMDDIAMELIVSIGPGQHDRELLRALVQSGANVRTIRSWPEFEVESWAAGSKHELVARHAAYRRIQRLTWATWRRIPWAKRWETPRAVLYPIFDLWARRYIKKCDLFVGWSQVCMHSLRRAKDLGAITLLEHPMPHVASWMRIVTEELETWGKGSHGSYSLFPGPLIKRMHSEYSISDRISTLSTFATSTFLEAGFPEERLIQVPLGVDVELFRPAPRRNEGFRILYAGRLELWKGVQYLLQAFSELRLPGAQLVLAGPIMPEMRPILEMFSSNGIRVLGPVPHAELAGYYQQADVLVSPTLNDAFGLVILEAMACGTPVITTDHSAGPDVIEDQVDGFVIPIRSVDAIKERLDWLYRHRDDAREIGSRARKKVVDRFTWDHYAERLIDAYDRILAPSESSRLLAQDSVHAA